jgi:hypothetical protein
VRLPALMVALLAVVATERASSAAPCSRDAVDAALVALGGPPLAEIADRVRIDTDGLTGSVSYEMASGDVIGPRVVRAPTCSELAKSLALVIVMSLRADEPREPRSVTRELTIEPPQRIRIEHMLETRGAVAVEKPLFASTRRLEVMVGAAGDIARRPALVVGGRWRSGHLSLGLELSVRTPLTIDVEAGGSVEVTQTGVDAVPCFHVRGLALCGLASAGMIGGEGHELAEAAHVRRAAAAVGARVELAVPVADRVSLRLHLDGLQTLDRTQFLVDEMAVWTSDSRELWLGAGVLANFP